MALLLVKSTTGTTAIEIEATVDVSMWGIRSLISGGAGDQAVAFNRLFDDPKYCKNLC